jgi:hypothetical protein
MLYNAGYFTQKTKICDISESAPWWHNSWALWNGGESVVLWKSNIGIQRTKEIVVGVYFSPVRIVGKSGYHGQRMQIFYSVRNNITKLLWQWQFNGLHPAEARRLPCQYMQIINLDSGPMQQWVEYHIVSGGTWQRHGVVHSDLLASTVHQYQVNRELNIVPDRLPVY